MKIISLTMVGNESEIIESFVRYNSNFIDKMVIVSTCCTDNTLLIIRKLIAEGYPLELYEEPDISFEQKLLDNKYMKKIALEEDADLFIPLDADEFITGNGNPRSIMESLPLDRVYALYWKNYAMSESDDVNEPFIPKRIINYKKKFAGNAQSKVIIPFKMILANHICLATGHHYVYSERNTTEFLENLMLAHYPATSMEQYVSRIYGNSIKFITWMNRSNFDASHINEQIMQIESGYDLYKIANGYGLDDDEKIEWVKDPIDLSFCKPGSLEIKYASLAVTNIMHNLRSIGQLMALKAYNLELDKLEDPSKPCVLIFGINEFTNNGISGLPENLINIRAYIDYNLKYKFSMFNRRLIITPNYIRFFQFDQIIIAGIDTFDLMKDLLLKYYVPEEKIRGIDYLFDLIEEEKM